MQLNLQKRAKRVSRAFEPLYCCCNGILDFFLCWCVRGQDESGVYQVSDTLQDRTRCIEVMFCCLSSPQTTVGCPKYSYFNFPIDIEFHSRLGRINMHGRCPVLTHLGVWYHDASYQCPLTTVCRLSLFRCKPLLTPLFLGAIGYEIHTTRLL